MDVIVCVKQVPDTEARIAVAPGGRDIVREGLPLALNPYDEFAIEAGLRLRERWGGRVTLLTVGPPVAEEALRRGLAMGADRAVRIEGPGGLGADPRATAAWLAAAIRAEPFDLVLTGRLAIDDYQEQVGGLLAERLGVPGVTLVTRLEVSADGRRAIVTHDVEGGEEELEVTLPAVLTCQKGLNEPRYPTLPNIVKARGKPLLVRRPAELGVTEPVGAGGLEVVELVGPPVRRAGRRLVGEPAAVAATLVRLLREEARVL